jgi:hypothetical protein
LLASSKLQRFDNPERIGAAWTPRLDYHGEVIFRSILSRKNHHRSRFIGALACLLAIAVLYAPLAASAFSPSAMACCTGGFCNIPKHHHKSNAASAEAPVASHAAASHEDCGHDMAANVTGMSNCSMDCCQTHETPAVGSVTFVMPPVFFAPTSMHVTRAAETARAIEIPRSIEPASPPPRFLSNIL